MLTFIGLGLNKKGISLKGLEEAKEADKVYAEFYTSLIPELDIEWLKEKVGNSIEVLDREGVEQKPEEVLKAAKEKKVAFLVIGDPMVATTHVDLRLRAKEAGVETRIVNAASVETAAPGLAGLQSYKFGRTATLPFPEKKSETPYDILEKNQEGGLHTLLLLDIEAEKEKYLTADEGIEYMLDLEANLNREVFQEDTLVVVVARAGSSDAVVKAGKAENLLESNFGDPPHVLIVPGKLHFMEAEALQSFADAEKELVDKYVEE